MSWNCSCPRLARTRKAAPRLQTTRWIHSTHSPFASCARDRMETRCGENLMRRWGLCLHVISCRSHVPNIWPHSRQKAIACTSALYSIFSISECSWGSEYKVVSIKLRWKSDDRDNPGCFGQLSKWYECPENLILKVCLSSSPHLLCAFHYLLIYREQINHYLWTWPANVSPLYTAHSHDLLFDKHWLHVRYI